MVAVEVVWIGIGDVPKHSEVPVGDVRAVEIGRRRSNAFVRVRRGATTCRRRRGWRWRWRRRRLRGEAAETEDRVELDRIRSHTGLAMIEVEKGDASDGGAVAEADGLSGSRHQAPMYRLRV